MTGLKICGMTDPDNITSIAALKPDYMGFIFYDNSPRNIKCNIPKLSEQVKKVGVFVNSSLRKIQDKIIRYDLQAIQLHGEESPEFCKSLKPYGVKIIKTFGIKSTFDFDLLKHYEAVCDYFLFDTKGVRYGGNGYSFDWDILIGYDLPKPFFLSGGIGLKNAEKLKSLLNTQTLPIHAVDVNSCFEVSPGIKDFQTLEQFATLMTTMG